MSNPIDPKELILNNKTLVATYVVALVPVVLYFLWIGELETQVDRERSALVSATRDLEDLQERIENMSAPADQRLPDLQPVRTEKDKAKLATRKGLYETALKDLRELVQSQDEVLERWFPKFADKGVAFDDAPAPTEYRAEWQDQIKILEQEEFPKLSRDPDGASMLFTAEPDRDPGNMRAYQKRFWIQRSILEALKDAGVEQLASRFDFSASQAAADEDAPFVTIPVRFGVLCRFTDLPIVTRELLRREVPMRILSVEVVKHPFIYEDDDPARSFRVEGDQCVFFDVAYAAKLENDDQFGSIEEWLPEPHVKIDFRVEAYDFKAIEQPAAADPNAPPSPGGG